MKKQSRLVEIPVNIVKHKTNTLTYPRAASELHKIVDANGLDRDMREKSITLLIIYNTSINDSVPRRKIVLA